MPANRFTIRASWLRDVQRLPIVGGVRLSLPFADFQGAVAEDEKPALGLLLAGLERVRLNTRPCCEACADMAVESFRTVESLARLALRALPSESQRGAGAILVRALANACQDFRTFVRTSPVPILPVPYKGWDPEVTDPDLRDLCLDSVKALSMHLSGVIAELKTLLGDTDLPERRHLRSRDWPQDVYTP